MLASLNVPGSSSTAPETTSNTQVAEVPLVATDIGRPNTADATMQGPVASAIHSLSGEHLVHVSPAASSGLSKFNSVSIPIDAQVNAKLKAKIWANEYLDFALVIPDITCLSVLNLVLLCQRFPWNQPKNQSPLQVLRRGHLPFRFLLGYIRLNIP